MTLKKFYTIREIDSYINKLSELKSKREDVMLNIANTEDEVLRDLNGDLFNYLQKLISELSNIIDKIMLENVTCDEDTILSEIEKFKSGETKGNKKIYML